MEQTTRSDRQPEVEPLFADCLAIFQVPSPDNLEMIEVTVRGIMDSETPAGDFIYYDLLDANKRCMNEDEPFDALPTQERVAEFFILQYIRDNPTSWLAIHILDVLKGWK